MFVLLFHKTSKWSGAVLVNSSRYHSIIFNHGVYCFRKTDNIETENEKCLNIPPCDANCKLSNWEEWSSCSASCRDTRTYNMPTRSRKREKLKDSVGKVGKLQPSMHKILTKRTKLRQIGAIWLPFFLKESKVPLCPMNSISDCHMNRN